MTILKDQFLCERVKKPFKLHCWTILYICVCIYIYRGVYNTVNRNQCLVIWRSTLEARQLAREPPRLTVCRFPGISRESWGWYLNYLLHGESEKVPMRLKMSDLGRMRCGIKGAREMFCTKCEDNWRSGIYIYIYVPPFASLRRSFIYLYINSSWTPNPIKDVTPRNRVTFFTSPEKVFFFFFLSRPEFYMYFYTLTH